jgi:hypothetical protein
VVAGVIYVLGMALILGFVICFIPVMVVLELRRTGADTESKDKK